jgi:CTP:molybdopterin cytidylyltransferase MocA
MSGKKSLHAIVLAAGASRRFGSPKQLVRFEGQLLIQRVIAAATELVGSAVSVVLGAHAAEITANLPPGTASIVINRGWQEGIGSSIRLAVSRLPGACDGVLVMLGDQPMVGSASLNRLAAAWRRQPRSIVASRYGAVTGVPAIFPRWCFSDLSALRGDQGARVLLSRYGDHVVRLSHPEAAVDIDYPEDLLELSSS